MRNIGALLAASEFWFSVIKWLGAAYLAGLAVGFWHDAGDIKANWQVDRVFEPTLSRDRAAEMMAGWAQAVERSKGWTH